MEFNAKRVDEANALVSATITKETVESNLDKNSIYSMNLQYLVILIFFS